MKALDAYKDMLKELDKYESPTFSIRDFNFFYNKALSRYIDSNYAIKDLRIKDDVDLQSVIKLVEPITLSSGGFANVPTDFRHLLSLKIKVKFLKDIGKYKKDQQVEFYPERIKSGQTGFRFRSAYGRPKYNRYYYQIAQNKIDILFDATVVEFLNAPNCWIDYIINPTEVYLNPGPGANYNNGNDNSVLVFNTGSVRNHVYYELLNVCRMLFLENIESPRTQAAAQDVALQ